MTEDLFRLLSAWAELRAKEAFDVQVKLGADCGPLVVSSGLQLHGQLVEGERIYWLSKNGGRLYFSGGAVADSSGRLTEAGTELPDAARLLELVYTLCTEGDMSRSTQGEAVR